MPRALAQLDRMIELYELPNDSRRRVANSVALLEDFPDAGSPFPGSWREFRFLLGPWPWMLLVHTKLDEDTVAIVSIEDSRSSTSATSRDD